MNVGDQANSLSTIVNLDQVKQLNSATIYKVIEQYAPISRVKIAKVSYLAPASVTKITRQLMENGLISEVDLQASTGGRRAISLAPNAHNINVIALKLGQSLLSIAHYKLSGEKLLSKQINVPAANDSATLIDFFISEIAKFMTQPALVNEKISNSENALQLKNGQNQIGFQYQTRYRSEGESQLFTSEIILISFTGNNQSYAITLPKLKSEKEFDQFNKNPQITLKDGSGKPVDFETGKLIKDGFQLNRDLVDEVITYNKTGKPASLNTIKNMTMPKSNEPESEVAGQMLDYWYNQADEKTRAAFKARINQ
jgi:uncharacterized protein YccT (UPF0319 family)/DNA-binding MarR family transcriptional regulator